MTDRNGGSSPPEALRGRLARLRYLLVAPTTFQRRLLQDMLRIFGVTSIAHSEGPQAACYALRQQRPDIVLWEWDNPDLEGLKQLSRAVLDMPQPAGIIVLATAPSAELVAAAVLAGAAGIVAKPFSTNVLMSQVAHAMARRTRQHLID